jgi:hypothetical protein
LAYAYRQHRKAVATAQPIVPQPIAGSLRVCRRPRCNLIALHEINLNHSEARLLGVARNHLETDELSIRQLMRGRRIVMGFMLMGNLNAGRLGYESLKQIEAIRGRFGLPVERDNWFKATKTSPRTPRKPGTATPRPDG